MLPGDRGVLYTSHNSPNGFDDANVVVQLLPVGTRKILVRGAYDGRYIASGHLIYIHESTLFAVPFDLNRLEVTGPPIAALDGLTVSPPVGAAQVAVSRTGTLVYLPGPRINYDAPVDWIDRGDRVSPLRAAPANWLRAVFSPDGRQLAMAIYDGKHYDNWVYDWARDALTRADPRSRRCRRARCGRLTASAIVFAVECAMVTRSTTSIWQRADGTGEPYRLTEQQRTNRSPPPCTLMARFIAFVENRPETGKRSVDSADRRRRGVRLEAANADRLL